MVKDRCNSRMVVLKRDGRKEFVHFDKITSRYNLLAFILQLKYQVQRIKIATIIVLPILDAKPFDALLSSIYTASL
jgi:hypothetical protein